MIAGVEASRVLALVVAALACGFDLHSRRIPNLLTFGSALAALLWGATAHGAAGVLTSLGGWLTGCAMLLPFFLLGGMGAGDVKLLAGIAAWLTPGEAMWAGLFTMIAGGAFGIVVALATGYLRRALDNILLLLAHWRISGPRPLSEVTLAEGRGPRLPYAIPIAAGTAVVCLWR